MTNHGYLNMILKEKGQRTSSARPKEAQMSKSRMKSMIIIFFYYLGILYKEFVQQSRTMNQTFYREVIECLWKRVWSVRPDIARCWIVHHDSAPSHTSFVSGKHLTTAKPPYNPDMVSCDYFLFPSGHGS